MIQKVLRLLDKVSPAESVYAHCDIPCGVYNTRQLKTAVETVEKMVQKLHALEMPKADTSKEDLLEYHNTVTRMVKNKEDWAKICKEELLILWTDYFKEPHLEMFPNLHETFWKAAKLCSENKQHVSMDAVHKLKKAVEEIDQMFEKAEAAKKK